MAHPIHHARSSVIKWGGSVDDYLRLHAWFDASKAYMGDFRHRALRHHAEGIFALEHEFGASIMLSSGREVPTRFIGEQHVREDLGFIPPVSEWLRCITPQPWMNRIRRLPSGSDISTPTKEDA